MSKRECPVCNGVFRRKKILSLYEKCVCGAIFTTKMHYIPEAQDGYFIGFLTDEYINGQRGFGFELDKLYRNKCTRNVLEIGCGVGTVLGAMQEKGWSCLGIDNAMSAVRKARELYPEACFIYGSTLDYNPDYSFGLIISNNTIEHFHEPRSVFNKAWELLEAGGIFSVQTPSTGFWIDKNLPWIHATETHHEGEHTVLFDTETLICLATQTGFEVEKIHDNPGPECIWIDFKKRWL